MSTFSKIGQNHLMTHKILSGLQLTFLGNIIENVKKKNEWNEMENCNRLEWNEIEWKRIENDRPEYKSIDSME